MTWPVPWGMVQAPPNAVAGAPAMNASAAAAAHRRFGPAQIKNGFPNASYAVRQGLRTTTEQKRQLSLTSRVNQRLSGKNLTHATGCASCALMDNSAARPADRPV